MAHCKELQIAYRAFATVQQRQLYIAKVDSIEKLFYNAKMANSRRSGKVGQQAQSIGRSAELRVIDELNSAGWRTVTSAELDYAGKTDARATCPAGRELPIQVSVNPKSSRAQRGLEDRGVTPVSIATLDRTKQTAPEFLCSQCPLETCSFRRISTDLGSTAIALMQAHKA